MEKERFQEKELHDMHMNLAVAEMNRYLYQNYKLVYRGKIQGRDMVEVRDITKALLKKRDPQHKKAKTPKLKYEEDQHSLGQGVRDLKN